jgi:hypothetical protein
VAQTSDVGFDAARGFDPAVALEQDVQAEACLEPSESRADAIVDTVPEGEVRRFTSAGVGEECAGRGVAGGIIVGGTDADRHEGARGDDAPTEFDIDERPADGSLHRTLQPQHLLDERVTLVAMGVEVPEPLRLSHESCDETSEQAGRREIAGRQEHAAGTHDVSVVQSLAVDLGGDERRDQIIRRVRPASAGDLGEELVLGEAPRLRGEQFRRARTPTLVGHERTIVRPFSELAMLLGGDPEQMGDHVHGKNLGVPRDEIGRRPFPGLCLLERGPELDREGAHPGLRVGHPTGGECLGHQTPQPGVAGRIVEHQRRVPKHRVVAGAHIGGEPLRVRQRRLHVVVRQQDPRPATDLQRALVPQFVVDRERVGEGRWLFQQLGVGHCIGLAHAPARLLRAVTTSGPGRFRGDWRGRWLACWRRRPPWRAAAHDRGRSDRCHGRQDLRGPAPRPSGCQSARTAPDGRA